MAKAIFPLRQLGRSAGDEPGSGAGHERIIERFLRALGGAGKPAEGNQS
jgi:hypothetical protein